MIPFDNKLAGALLDWYALNGVDYPWTEIADPWAVWVSEVMLQQTTVTAVTPRYRRWMERFPDPESLAGADEEQVLLEWEGLGYYNRARNLASAAGEVISRYGGKVPGEVSELKTLPGVGDYIASAVASFAFGEKTAAIEANGRRIAMRLAASAEWNAAMERELRQKLEEAMSDVDSGKLNGALMQLGQLLCTPSSPSCEECPLASVCRARETGQQEAIPPGRKQQVVRKNTTLALCLGNGRVFVKRRVRGIGKGLWVFPSGDEADMASCGWKILTVLPAQVHTYTRYRETLVPKVYVRVDSTPRTDNCLEEKGVWTDIAGMEERPMPTAYRRIAVALAAFVESSSGKQT